MLCVCFCVLCAVAFVNVCIYVLTRAKSVLIACLFVDVFGMVGVFVCDCQRLQWDNGNDSSEAHRTHVRTCGVPGEALPTECTMHWRWISVQMVIHEAGKIV